MKISRIFNAVLAAALWIGPGLAISPGLAQEFNATATVLQGWRAPSGVRMTALRIDMSDGWHTYWRSPGDVGIPPRFHWQGSRNLDQASVHWPRPQVFDSYGARTLGYKNAVVIPLSVTPTRPDRPVILAGSVDIGVCRDICVPVTLTFRAALDGTGARDPAILDALDRVPAVTPGPSHAGFGCRVDPIADGLRLTAKLPLARMGDLETAVIEYGDGNVWVSAPGMTRRGRDITVVADMVPANAQPFALDRSRVTLSVFGDAGGLELAGCPAGG